MMIFSCVAVHACSIKANAIIHPFWVHLRGKCPLRVRFCNAAECVFFFFARHTVYTQSHGAHGLLLIQK